MNLAYVRARTHATRLALADWWASRRLCRDLYRNTERHCIKPRGHSGHSHTDGVISWTDAKPVTHGHIEVPAPSDCPCTGDCHGKRVACSYVCITQPRHLLAGLVRRWSVRAGPPVHRRWLAASVALVRKRGGVKPRMVDLFCKADGLKYRHGHGRMPALRGHFRDPAADSQILLTFLLQSLGLEGCQGASVPPLRQGLPCHRCWGREPAALLQGVRQESQCQAGPCVAGGTSGDQEGLPGEPAGQGRRRRAQAVASETRAHTRTARRPMCRVWRVEPSLASRRLHPDWAEQSVSPSPALQVRIREPAPLPGTLRQPSLRADPHGSDRGDRHNPVRAAS